MLKDMYGQPLTGLSARDAIAIGVDATEDQFFRAVLEDKLADLGLAAGRPK